VVHGERGVEEVGWWEMIIIPGLEHCGCGSLMKEVCHCRGMWVWHVMGHVVMGVVMMGHWPFVPEEEGQRP
jgi:hypothetical protein